MYQVRGFICHAILFLQIIQVSVLGQCFLDYVLLGKYQRNYIGYPCYYIYTGLNKDMVRPSDRNCEHVENVQLLKNRAI